MRCYSLINPVAGQITGTALLGGSAAGNAYQEKINLGYSDDEARAYGYMVGASEAVLEYVLGGVTKLGGGVMKNIAAGALDKIDNVLARVAKTTGGKLLMAGTSEAIEEGLQSIIEPYIWQAVSGEEAKVDWEETLYSSLLGFMTGGMFEGIEQISGGKQDTEQAPISEHISMADFINTESPLWRNVAYEDTDTKNRIMLETHNAMVSDGAVVKVSEEVAVDVQSAFPDLRNMKKQERTPILKATMSKLKSDLRQFLNGFKDQKIEFEVNGKILDAKLYNTGINEVLDKVTKQKAEMLYSTGGIFQNARYLYSTPDYAGDPNVYRWNYFYTPVQIGEDTVGVRIAVRDVATPQESQIYNWGIKKDASLDGEGRGIDNRISHDVSSDAFNNSISNSVPGVNGENVDPLAQLARETVEARYNAEDGVGVDGISAEGKAILGDEAVEVADIADAGGGKVTVKLADGRSVDATALEYEDSDEAELWRVIGKYAEDADSARALLEEYRNGDLDAYKYARGIEEAFLFGKLNLSPKEMELKGSYVNLLDPAQRNMAYQQGKIAGEKKAQQTELQQKNIDAVYKQAQSALKQKGTDVGEHSVQLADGLTVEKMGKTQRPSYELAKMIAPAVQADIRVYNGGKEWGYYDHKTDTICLNINAKWSGASMMSFTLAHELVHRAKRGSPVKYDAFADFLIQQYGEQGSSVNAMVQQQLQAAEENNISMTYEEALEEVICDACQKMLVDTDAGKRLAEFGAKSAQNKSIVKQFGQWIKELMQKLRRIFRNVEPDSLAAQEFQKFDDNVKQILADMFVDMSMDAGEKLSTIKAAGMTEKITTDKGGVKKKLPVAEKPYSYSWFIKKPDMQIIQLEGTVPESREDIFKQAKQNAAKVGTIDPKTGNVSVHVADIGINVVLGKVGLKHGLDRRNETIGLVTLKAGEILQSSIRINELTPKKPEADASYVLIGVARNGDGELHIVRSTVNRFTHKLTTMDVLYAINAKKGNRLRSMRPGFQGPVTDSTISISNLLDYVNQYFPDILPEDVLKHYGHTERPDGDLGESALYKLPVSKDAADRGMLVDLFEQMVTDSNEHKALQNYKKNINQMLALEEKVDRLTEEIKRVSFAEGPRDMEYLNNLKAQRKKAVAELNRFDNILLGLEKSGVLRAMIDRNRQMIQQETRDKVREYYRQKNETREAEIRQKNRNSRKATNIFCQMMFR